MSIARHTTYNVIGAVVPIAVSLVTVPLYLKLIGLDRYGILSLCWLLVGYFSFFDFGLGRATAQHIARLHGGEAAVRSRAFWTGLTLSAGLALIALLVAIPLGWIALNALKVGTPQLRAETQAALPLLIAAVPLAIIQSILKGALEGRQRFFAVNAILSAGAVATGVLPLIAAAIWGPVIPLLVAISLGVRGVVLVALALLAVSAVPVRRYALPDPDDMRKMMRFGAWLTVTNIVSPIMSFIDRFLIGAALGSTAIALYVIPFNLVSQLVVAPTALAVAMFPRLAATDAVEAQSLSRAKVDFLSFALTPLTIAGVCLLGPFLRLWIGPNAAAGATPVGIVLLFGFWVNSLSQLPYLRLQAGGRTDITAKIHLAECLPYIGALWICMKQFGIVGAAIAWSLRCTGDFVALAVSDKVGRDTLLSTAFRGALILAVIAAILSPGWSTERLPLVAIISLLAAWHLQRKVPPDVHALLQRVIVVLTETRGVG